MEIRVKYYEKEAVTNIKYVGYYSMNINGEISTNSVKEAIRKRDAEISFKEYVKDKFGYKSEFMDIEARNSFQSKDVIPSVIKCAHGFKQYGVRDAMINGNLTGMECPRCNEDET